MSKLILCPWDSAVKQEEIVGYTFGFFFTASGRTLKLYTRSDRSGPDPCGV